MIKITQDEAFMLRKEGRGEDVHMSSKSHKSRGKRYFATRNPLTVDLLNTFRKERILSSHGR